MTDQQKKPEPPFAWAARRKAEREEAERELDREQMEVMDTVETPEVELTEVPPHPLIAVPFRRPLAVTKLNDTEVLVVCDDGSVWRSYMGLHPWQQLTPIPGTEAAFE